MDDPVIADFAASILTSIQVRVVGGGRIAAAASDEHSVDDSAQTRQ